MVFPAVSKIRPLATAIAHATKRAPAKLPIQESTPERVASRILTVFLSQAAVRLKQLPVKRSAPQMTVSISPRGKTMAKTSFPIEPQTSHGSIAPQRTARKPPSAM